MLVPDQFYHIYNHANGTENLFREQRNYYFFLTKVNLYLSPVFDLYAYCLMPNHFHLLVSVKNENEIRKLLESSTTFQKLNTIDQFDCITKTISKSIANLCSSYTQAFNKVYHRKGSLFMPNFKSNIIEDDLSFCKMVHYIHANPVHHGFTRNIAEWTFSSYKTMLSEKETMLKREYILKIFGSRHAFIDYHQQPIEKKQAWYDCL